MLPQINAQEYICGACDDAITNPICPECLERQIVAWLSTRAPEHAEAVKGTKDIFDGFSSPVTCIICGENMNVCPHCFVREVYHLLGARDRELGEEFRQHFNYDLI